MLTEAAGPRSKVNHDRLRRTATIATFCGDCSCGCPQLFVNETTASLFGYIGGPHGDMSWLTEHLAGENPTADRLLTNVGAILAGNRTFGGDDPNRGTDSEGAFGGRYGPVFVLTHRPPAEPTTGVTFATDLHSAVMQTKEAAGNKYVNILGANVAKQCIEASLCSRALAVQPLAVVASRGPEGIAEQCHEVSV